MNEWVSKSIKIANSSGYLDRLHEIYPVIHEAERKIAKELEAQLKRVYDEDDDVALVKELLRLEKFPIKDPYVAFLRKKDAFIGYNPETVARIAKRIRDMGFQEMLSSIKEPKEFNRQIGPLFKRWIPRIGYPVLAEAEFKEYDQDVAFLQGNDRQLQNFANDYLGCELAKGPDFIARVREKFVVGEAKFLTDYGGHQSAQFRDALELLRGKKGKAVRVAVLDGIVWIEDSTRMYKAVSVLEEIALTALLLKEFLQSLRLN